MYEKALNLKKYGDPYDTVCTLIKIDDTTAMVKGLVGNITKKDLIELKYLAAKYGFEEVIWERKKA